jgi:phosphopantetheine adenylyltransferase
MTLSSPADALLLLPALSLPLSRPSLHTAYKGTVESLLTKLKPSLNTTKSAIFRLDVAVGLSSSYRSTASANRTELYDDLQTLLLEVYTLVCIAAVSANVDLDVPGGLDVRVILIEPDVSSIPSGSAGNQHLSGPLVDLPTYLTLSPPTRVFGIESETGIALEKAYISGYQSLHRNTPTITRLTAGPSLNTTIPTSPLLPTDMTASINPFTTTSATAHHSVAVGGTFDHLHIGHKLLLTATLLLANPTPSREPRTITVGITGDSLLTNKKHATVLESWDTRYARCAAFLESILAFSPSIDSSTDANTKGPTLTIKKRSDTEPNGHVISHTYHPPSSSQQHSSVITINYTRIEDPFGPTITDEAISALVISAETRSGGAAVNEKRREKGWAELQVFEVGVLDASPSDDGEVKDNQGAFEGKISSTEIRRRIAEQAG